MQGAALGCAAPHRISENRLRGPAKKDNLLYEYPVRSRAGVKSAGKKKARNVYSFI